MTPDDPLLAGLLQALEATPDNHAIRLLLAKQYAEREQWDDAFEQVARLLDADALPGEDAVQAGGWALDAGRLPLVERCLSAAEQAGQIDGVANLRQRMLAAQAQSGVVALRVVGSAPPAHGAVESETPLSFNDVGGLAKVKKLLHRRIILPFTRPGLLERYRKRAGGGVLLYGPPGCGKTLLARATAGECRLPFFVVRIDQILSAFIGQSEQNLHAAFEQARASAPCVLFLDEIDALGFARSRMQSEHTRGLVDQLLQELDSISADNENLLVLAATNAPWDLDDALLRPGRFDRTVFVPPPDEAARAEILKIHLADRPVQGLSLDAIAQRTERFSGADLEALVERAYDEVIEEALASDTEPPATMEHFETALEDQRASTGPWLERARNYVEFANRDDRYEDVAKYLGIKRGWRLF
ncbi:MAG: tetratricopeptide repeat protein [Myxococcota bacterium]